jgi:putative oxidoreductase
MGLLVLRLGVGLSMLGFHGWDKLTGGPETWEGVGASMGNLGLAFAPKFWGFMAASAETFASALLVLGIFFRPAAAVLAFTMIVAASRHLSIPAGESGAGWNGASHALELFSIYVALLLTGPGRLVLPGSFGRQAPRD